MRRFLALVVFIALCKVSTAQTRRDLELQRQKTLEEINYVDNLIKLTNKEKSSGLNDLKIIGNKLVLRENILSGMKEELGLINERIELNSLALKLMEDDLVILRKDYARAIVNSFKSRKGIPDIAYLLSAKDFNQGYKRLKYLQQVTTFRRRESETIIELKEQIENTKLKLEEDLGNVSDLKEKEENQKRILQEEQNNKKRLISSLGRKEKQLQNELSEKKKVAQKIEAEINRLVEEERRKALKTEMTPEMKLIGDSFSENMGRLPWPVEKGIVTGSFGKQKHPELIFIEENNPGIEITCSGKTPVRSVFKGQIAAIFAIKGENMAIIIRHGRYFSVYQNLVNVTVKQGDLVDTKQNLGEIFCDTGNGGKSIMKFMIFEDKDKKDPEQWLAKK